jgi:predicted ester cyclase
MLEKNKALVRKYYEVTMGDMAGIEEVVSENFVDHHFPPDIPPGPEGVRQFFINVLGSVYSDAKLEIRDLIAEGDKVDCHFTLHAKHTGEFAGIPPKGNPIHLTLISTFLVEGDRLVEAWELFDSGDLLAQMKA